MELLVPKIAVASLTDEERKKYNRLKKKPFGRDLAMAVYQTMKDRKSKWSGVLYRGTGYCGIGLFLDKYGRALVQAVYRGTAALPVIIKFSSNEHEFVDWLAGESEQSISLFGERFTGHSITKARLVHYLNNQNGDMYSNETLNARDGQWGGLPDEWFLAE